MQQTRKRQGVVRLPSLNCPHCRTKMVVRDSQEVTALVRELRMTCANEECGFTAVGQLSFIRQVRPSAAPNPEVRLPFGTWSKKPPANDDHREPANDDRLPAADLVKVGVTLAGAAMT